MANIDLSKYGITGAVEVLHNPSYEVLFQEETKAGLEGFEKGQETVSVRPASLPLPWVPCCSCGQVLQAGRPC